MKKYIINLFASIMLLFIFAGCAPQLARTKYGTTEKQWEGYIQESYSDWEPPPTLPPINDSSVSGDAANDFSVDNVPEAMPGNDLTILDASKNTEAFPEITSPGSKQLAPVVDPDAKTYTVKKGDTLWSISCRFFNNDGTKWKKIQEANKDILSSPGSIKPGLTLTIPTK